jgi:hypothetical protein
LRRNARRGAVITIFTGVLFCILICFYAFSDALDIDRSSRDFARTVARIVPAGEPLVSYQKVSTRFVQYYGKSVGGVTDLSELQACYDKGDWIICLSGRIDDLKERSFRVVYAEESMSGEHKADAGGVLFHKE